MSSMRSLLQCEFLSVNYLRPYVIRKHYSEGNYFCSRPMSDGQASNL